MKSRTLKEDIRDVIAEETSRGRRLDTNVIEEERRTKNDYFKLFKEGNLRTFKKYLSSLGLREGSDQYQKIMKHWNEVQKQKQ